MVKGYAVGVYLRRYATRQFARWVTSVTGYTVLGPDVQVPRPDPPWVGLTLIGQRDEAPREADVIGGAVAWDIDLSGADGVNPVGLRVADRIFDLAPAAGVADVLTAIEDSDLAVDGWFDAVATGPDTLRITTAVGAAPPGVEALQNVVVTPFAVEDYSETRVAVRLRVRATCYALTRSEVDAIGDILSEARSTKPALVRSIGSPVPVSVQVDARREPQTYVDVVLTAQRVTRRPLEPLEAVDVFGF